MPSLPHTKAPQEKRQKKETLLSAELGKYLDKKVRVKFQGGREGKMCKHTRNKMLLCKDLLENSHVNAMYKYLYATLNRECVGLFFCND